MNDQRTGNQKFTVRVTVEVSVWPGLPDRDDGTILACVRSQAENQSLKGHIEVVGLEVVKMEHIPLASCASCRNGQTANHPFVPLGEFVRRSSEGDVFTTDTKYLKEQSDGHKSI